MLDRNGIWESPAPSLAPGEGRATELARVVDESLLGVKRAWLASHQRGPTALSEDDQRRQELAVVIGAALALSQPGVVMPASWQDAASRIPATLTIEIARQNADFLPALAAVAIRLADSQNELREGDFAVLDRFASLVARCAATGDTFLVS